MQTVAKPQMSEISVSEERVERRARDTAHSPTYVCSAYRSASPPPTAALSLIPQQQQQQQSSQTLQKQFQKYSHYEEDYLATEV